MLPKNASQTICTIFLTLLLLFTVPGCGQVTHPILTNKPINFVPPTSERIMGRTASTGTLPPPSHIEPYQWPQKGFKKIYENDILSVSFKESRDIFQITDKRSGYIWSSGIDAGFREEEMMNPKYASFANSFITFDYFENQGVLNKQSSTLISENGEIDFSTLFVLDENHFLLQVDTGAEGFAADVEISFIENKMNVYINPETIQEKSPDKALAALYIAPFLGAVGGRLLPDNISENKVSAQEKMPEYDGYLFVPDGPGALIRFKENSTSLSPYVQRVYGPDIATAYTGTTIETNRVDPQIAHFPVYGVAHGYNQAAFLAYATSGAEYMEITATPRGNTTLYYYVANRYLFRSLYFQTLNQQKEGIDQYPEQKNDFPIAMTFEFLADSQANYVGMAQAYRRSLSQRDLLPDCNPNSFPKVRLDFLMADVKRSAIGLESVIMTTGHDLLSIADDLNKQGIQQFEFGLYGFQSSGLNAQNPGQIAFNKKISDVALFLEIQNFLEKADCKLSFAQNYALFTSAMADAKNSAAMHISSQYCERIISFAKPVFDRYHYARPQVMAEWFLAQATQLKKSGFNSITAEGLCDVLISDFSSRHELNRSEAIEKITAALGHVHENGFDISAKKANEYALKYLNTLTCVPMFHSQYLIETDTVPFMQIVLSGLVDLYAPYANFSFYSQQDVLRMIDYGVYPSFLITAQSSHLLSKTNSNDLYATSYTNLRSMIQVISREVTNALAPVKGEQIISREVVSPDVVLVTYSNNTKIMINYSNRMYKYENYTIQAQDYLLLEGD